MRAIVVSTLLLIGSVAACADKPEPPKKVSKPVTEQLSEPESEPAPEPIRLADGVHVELGNEPESRCARTLCIGGPGEFDDKPNIDLGDLCRRGPGVLRRCEGEQCRSMWTLDEWQQGLEALIASLDRDGDGQLDERARDCRINLAGWSQGGVIAAEKLPELLRADPRMSEARAVVDHLVAIAPWAPERTQIDVAENVRKAFVYRHSKTPDDDCSKDLEGGPRLSPPPVCGSQTRCFDYDYSLEPLLTYVGRRGVRSGSEVGHCNIVSLVAKIGIDNLARGREALHELVPPYANGERGGRIHTGPVQPDPPKLLDPPIRE